MPGNDEWEKFKAQITWKEVKTRNVRDGIGREFNWTKLNGKTIYICGHGGHIWIDGFCTVPENTTITFYQPYGLCLVGQTLEGFIKRYGDVGPGAIIQSRPILPEHDSF